MLIKNTKYFWISIWNSYRKLRLCIVSNLQKFERNCEISWASPTTSKLPPIARQPPVIAFTITFEEQQFWGGIPCTFDNLGPYRTLPVASKKHTWRFSYENWRTGKLLKTAKITKKCAKSRFWPYLESEHCFLVKLMPLEIWGLTAHFLQFPKMYTRSLWDENWHNN